MQILDVVALVEDIPDTKLKRGQVGTIVEQWDDDVFEVEFSDQHGHTYAFASLHTRQMLVLHWEPLNAP